MKIVPTSDPSAIQQALTTLNNGGLIIYPTETCYGIGADATNQEAIDKLLSYKTKRNDKPLSIAVANGEMAAQYVDVNAAAQNMYDHFLPGPITVISRGLGKLARGVESALGTQGIRIPDYPFTLKLIEQFGRPITATSANASYKKTPYALQDILNNTTQRQQSLVDLFLDAGTLPYNKPSTVVDTTLDTLHIVREGSLKLKGTRLFLSHSVEQTNTFAAQLLAELAPHIGTRLIVILMQGDLGAGKTHTSKAIAKELGVQDVVASPTYTIAQEYKGSTVTVHHIDTYRLYDPSELDDLRPDQIFQAPNVVLIEWANKVRDHIEPWLKDAIVIQLVFETASETVRRIAYDITGIQSSVPTPSQPTPSR